MVDLGIVASATTIILGIAAAFLGTKLKGTKALLTEATEALAAIKNVLADNKVTKDELESVVKEIQDVVKAVKALK